MRKSLIADIFAGKFRSTVHIAGNQKSIIHEPFFTLSLDIKVRTMKNIRKEKSELVTRNLSFNR